MVRCVYFPYPTPRVTDETRNAISGYEPRYAWFFDDIRKDIEEFASARRISRAQALSEATGQPLADRQYPMYFTGDLDAQFVLVHLNPKQADDAAETVFPVRTFEQYFDVHRNWGARMYGSDGYRKFKSRFDRKQVRFLRPFNVIDFGPDDSEDGLLRNLERVVDDKLQLELVPYGSDTFNARAFAVPEVKAHFQRVLRVIAATNRKYVLFCGAVFGPLIGDSVTKTHRFNLKRKDGALERASSEFSNLSIPYEGRRISAGWCRSWARQGIPMESYAGEVISRYGSD